MKNIKSLMLTLILGLGVILSTASCSKQSAWEDQEYLTIDVYNEGTIMAELFKLDGSVEIKLLQPNHVLAFKQSETKALTVTGLDVANKARMNGHIVNLKAGEQYTWYYQEDTNIPLSKYSAWQECINKSDGSDLELEGCDTQFNIN